MTQYIIYFIQSLLILLLTPLFMGVIKSLKAYFRGYKGFPVFQVYYNLIKLFKKGRVISTTSSFITELAPALSLTFAVTAAFLVPVFYTGHNSPLGNLFIIIFLLGISKFLYSLLGLDSASTFGGMGASRELFISMSAEPIMFVMITFLFIEFKSFNIYDIAFLNAGGGYLSVPHIIAAAAFFMVLIAENARIPIDNPETHLELTMIHEAMILDLSGSDLAMVELASSIKLVLFLTLFLNSFFAFGISTSISLVLMAHGFLFFIIKMFICLTVISLIETSMAKFRLFRVPEILAAALSLGVISVAIYYFM